LTDADIINILISSLILQTRRDDMKPQIITTSLIALFIMMPALSLADYHYVSHSGSDEYPYTSWETATDSIQLAIDATSPHDTLYIAAGEWWQSAAVQDFDSIAIIGMGIDSTFWYSDVYRTANLTLDYECSAEDITFERNQNWICVEARAYAGVRINSCRFIGSAIGLQINGDCEVASCIFDSCGQIAISIPSWNGSYVIRNNIINQIIAYPNGWAFYLQVHSAVVRNNIIILPEHRDVVAMSSGRLDGDVYIHNNVVIHGNSGITVDSDGDFNNLVKDMGWDPTYGSAIGYSSSIYNNSITGCLNGIAAGEGISISYNNLWQNAEDFLGSVSDSIGNIFRDPMYVNPDSFDFRLQAFSPLIDAGDPNILDVDGTRSDIGIYGGPYGAFYDYLDLPPNIPDSISYRVWNDTIYLDWRDNYEADFFGYSLHRDIISGFTPSSLNLLAEPESSFYADGDVVLGETYYYRIASLDNQGNRSEYSTEVSVTVTAVWQEGGIEMPRMTVIESSYPNPFNSATTIVYSVAALGPVPAEITIEVYDIMGRKVKTLINERKEVGIHRVIWDGKGDSGEDMTSGIYFARISQWGLNIGNRPRKITLVR
jgi:hypothetical protein